MRKKMNHYLCWVYNRPIVRNFFPANWYIRSRFYEKMGYYPDLNSPSTFNEKLQWLKLHNRKPEYIEMVDKYLVREFVRENIEEDILIPIVGGPWSNVNEINIDELPEQFVLKCTHDSASVIICKDKINFNFEDAKSKLKKALRKNYYWYGREWPYRNVKPQIIAEKYMHDCVSETSNGLRDYKLMCFNGNVKCSFVCSNRFGNELNVTFFDNEWNVLPFERSHSKSKSDIPKPTGLEKMISYAEKLAKKIPFVRVDFYEVDSNIYFGEMTFFPGCGFEAFQPPEWDGILGDWIVLDSNGGKNG